MARLWRLASSWSIAALLSLAASAPRVTRAQTHARIEWREPAPADCIDAREVERTVETRLGRSLQAEAADALRIEASFAASEPQPSVRLELVAPSGERLGERVLAATSCAELQSSLPVVIAVLLELEGERPSAAQPAAVPQPQAGTAVVERTPGSAASAAARAPDRAPARPAQPAAWPESFELGLGAQGALGLQPGLGLGLALEATLELWRPLALTLWADLRLPSATDGREQLVLQSGTLGAGLCARFALSRALELGACAKAGAMRLAAWGRGFERSADDRRWLGEARLLGRLQLRVAASIVAHLELGPGRLLERPHYGYLDESGARTPLYRPAAFFGLVQLGAGVRWQ